MYTNCTRLFIKTHACADEQPNNTFSSIGNILLFALKVPFDGIFKFSLKSKVYYMFSKVYKWTIYYFVLWNYKNLINNSLFLNLVFFYLMGFCEVQTKNYSFFLF